MRKQQLDASVDAKIIEIRDALQTMLDALNPGQQKQVVKDEKVKNLFDLYGVSYNK